jgi:hypothetical protein
MTRKCSARRSKCPDLLSPEEGQVSVSYLLARRLLLPVDSETYVKVQAGQDGHLWEKEKGGCSKKLSEPGLSKKPGSDSSLGQSL